jgi:hypothetical protein
MFCVCAGQARNVLQGFIRREVNGNVIKASTISMVNCTVTRDYILRVSKTPAQCSVSQHGIHGTQNRNAFFRAVESGPIKKC